MLRELAEKRLSPEDWSRFLRIDAKSGVVSLLGLGEIAPVYDTGYALLYVELERIMGDAGRGLIGLAMRNAGNSDARELKKAVEEKLGRELTLEECMNIAYNVMTCWGSVGWGVVESFEVSEKEIVVIHKNSPECRGYLKLLERGVVDKHSETGRSVVALHYL